MLIKQHKTQWTKNLLTPPAPQPPINVNVNPFQPSKVKPEKRERKPPIKILVVRNMKSRTKAGTWFKPSDLDETGSNASVTSFIHSSIASQRAHTNLQQ